MMGAETLAMLRVGTRRARRRIRAWTNARTAALDSTEAVFPDGQYFEHPLAVRSIATPELTLWPLLRSAEHLRSECYETPEWRTGVVEEALYCTSNNVLMNRERVVAVDSINANRSKDRLNWKAINAPVFGRIKGYATVLRSVSNGFYHTMASNLPRLYALHFQPLRSLDVTLVVPGRLSELERFLLERLLPERVRLAFVEPERVYKLDKLVFLPFLNRQFMGYVPEEYIQFLHRRLIGEAEPPRWRRLYISRKHARMRRCMNETELRNTLARNGFEAVMLETLPFQQQVELFAEAESVAGLHGAGFANLLYTREPNVLEIFPRERMKPTFYFMAKGVGGAYGCVRGEGRVRRNHSVSSRMNDDIWVDTDEVQKALFAS
jgi:capsular polysaccharide biosynthesis protein